MSLNDSCTLGELFVQAIRRYESLTALVDDQETLTYGQLGERIARYAQIFRQAGLKRGDGLAQLSANRVDAAAAIGAAFVCGLRYTPLNARASDEDLVFIIRDSQVSAVVVDEASFGEKIERFRQARGGSPPDV